MVSPLHMQACKHAQNMSNMEGVKTQLATLNISEDEPAITGLTTVQDEVASMNAPSIDETSSLRITLTCAETSSVCTNVSTADPIKALIILQTQDTPNERILAATLAKVLRQLDDKKAQLAEGWDYVRDLKCRLESTKAKLEAANPELDVAEANEIEAEERLAAAKSRADRYKARVTEMQCQQIMSDVQLETAHVYSSSLKAELREARKELKVAAVNLEAEKALRESSDALLVVSRVRTKSLESQLIAALARSGEYEAGLKGKM